MSQGWIKSEPNCGIRLVAKAPDYLKVDSQKDWLTLRISSTHWKNWWHIALLRSEALKLASVLDEYWSI
jgi:hypothetical protein